MKTTQIGLLAMATLLSMAMGRLGIGPCPTNYPKKPISSVNLRNGRFYIRYIDNNMVFGYNMFAQNKSLKFDCFAANVSAIAQGFYWDPYTVFPELKYCRKDVHCDFGSNTCNCYVYAKPYDLVYFEEESQTAVIYQCWSFKNAFDTFNKNLGYPPYMAVIGTIFSPLINHLHYTGLAVASQQVQFTNTAAKNLKTFVNNFPDLIEGGYTVPITSISAMGVAYAFGYNGKANYSMSDLTIIKQDICNWDTTP
jgi:hypothetical protein